MLRGDSGELALECWGCVCAAGSGGGAGVVLAS